MEKWNNNSNEISMFEIDDDKVVKRPNDKTDYGAGGGDKGNKGGDQK